ncbi:MAG: DUF3298 domain-containing protein [Neisseriaceae bacterium]|nr:MAG: DUF3298 domain-containing protein [Neisseriaceae bacterium]
MQKQHLLTISLMYLMLLACQPKDSDVNNTDNLPINEQTTYPNKIQKAQPITLKLNGQRCQSIDKEKYCDEIIIRTDSFKNVGLNNYVYQTITGSENKLDKDLKTALTDYIKNQLKELTFQQKDTGTGLYTEQSSDDFQLVNNNANFAFFKHEYTAYTGGIHPNTSVHNLVIDPKSYNDILLDNMFLPNGQDKLWQLQQDAILQTLLSIGDASEQDVKELMSSWDIKLNKNWGFDNNNLLFTYSPYEAAPYSYGVIDIAIPKEKLKDIIQPKYLDMIFNDSNHSKDRKNQ